MRLSKSRDGEKYVLTFEISPAEAAAGGVSLSALWQSKKLTDFIEALSKMTKQPAPNEPFAEKLRQARAAFNGTARSPFEKAYYQTFTGQPKQDPGAGSFTSREQMDEFMRRQQAPRTPPRASLGQGTRHQGVGHPRRNQIPIPHPRQRKSPRPRRRPGQVLQDHRSLRSGVGA